MNKDSNGNLLDDEIPKYDYGDILAKKIDGTAIVVMHRDMKTKTYFCEEQNGNEDDLTLPFNVCHGLYRKLGVVENPEPHPNFVVEQSNDM